MRLPRHTAVQRLALSLLLIALLAACSQSAAPVPPPRPVLVEHPQPLNGESGEVFPGAVHAREEADLSFRVPGKIRQRLIDAGASVKAGQTLATLDAEDAKLNLQAAKAALAAAEADVALAEADRKRHKELLDKGFISPSLYELRENTLKLAQARSDQARANLAVVNNQSRYTTLTATKAGLITAVLSEAGQVVAAGQPVFRFAAGGEREVLIHVPEGRVDALRKADKLSVRLWARPGAVLPAKLRELNTQADPSTRMHDARVSITGDHGDVDLGTSAAVIIGERVDPSLFLVSLSAIGGSKDKPGVWAVEDGKPRFVTVEVQRYLESGAVIKAKLTPDMSIVSAGAQLVVPDQPVKAIERVRPGQSP